MPPPPPPQTFTPTPLHYTLRLKHHKTTILILADPLLPLSHIKSELLRALQSRYPSGTLNNHSIPPSAEEIELAKPVDVHDAAKGWVRLDVGDRGETPKSAGLRDGSVLAFRFRGAGAGAGAGMDGSVGRRGKKKQEDEGVDVNDVEEDEGEWDVVLPSYEDSTGTMNEGDVGGGGGGVFDG